MVTPSSKKSGGPVLRSLSPSGRFYVSLSNTVPSSSSSAFASSTNPSFSSLPSSHHHHRVNLYTSPPLTQLFRFSPNNRSISVSKQRNHPISAPKKTCMCSPTTHPGSFRCSLHKNLAHPQGQSTASCPSNRLNMRRSAMTNSLVRIGGVEGEWVKRALTALIRPSSHQQRRRAAFQPCPSRFSVMSKADDPR